MSKTIKCPGCLRRKAKKLFVPLAGKNKGKRYRFGFCRDCSQATACSRKYDAKKVARAKKNCPKYAESIRVAVREEMRTKRREGDVSYHQGIIHCNKARQTKAIQKLFKIQGNYCAMEKKSKCDFGGVAPNFDHKREDGRLDKSRDCYMMAAEILRMKHPEEKYQLLCRKHNIIKYHQMSPYRSEDEAKRAASRASSR